MTRANMFEKIRMGEAINGHAQLWLVDLIREHYDVIECLDSKTKKTMNAYKITRTDEVDYDEYDSVICTAETTEEALKVEPEIDCYNTWFKFKEHFEIELIGVSNSDKSEWILASFNAG